MVGLDPNPFQEIPIVSLEAVGRVMGAHPREEPKGETCKSGKRGLEKRSSNLLTPCHVSGGSRDDDSAFDQSYQIVNSPRVVTAVSHGHYNNRSARPRDAEPDCPGRTSNVFVYDNPKPLVTIRLFGNDLDSWILRIVNDHNTLER